MEDSAKPNPGVLTLTIKDKSVLYATYMSFLKEGGIFIPTTRLFRMSEKVSLLLNLMKETEKLPVDGKVVWITPKSAQGNRAQGIGVQFEGDNAEMVRNKIETYLGGALKSGDPTHTL